MTKCRQNTKVLTVNYTKLMTSKLTKNQKKTFVKTLPITTSIYGEKVPKITVTIRYDDRCGNGHNSFSITGEIGGSSGCIHEEIAKHFPELKKYIKWHLMSSDGPMHYLANTLYLAGDKDYNGCRKGEQRRCKRSGLLIWKPKTYSNEYVYGNNQPIVTVEYEPLLGEGKERDLDGARRAAIWPEATDEDLCSPDLEQKLKARLPALIEEFRKDVEELGFVF